MGLDALRGKGAMPWPNPQDADAFECVFNTAAPVPSQTPKPEPSQFSCEALPDAEKAPPEFAEVPPAIKVANEPNQSTVSTTEVGLVELVPETVPTVTATLEAKPQEATLLATTTSTPADMLFAVVRDVMLLLLKAPMKDAEVATALDISNAQAKAWLLRLLDECAIEKQKKPVGYIVKQSGLFE